VKSKLSACALMLLVLSAGHAAAEEPRSATADEASAHFRRGAEFYNENNLDAALAEFTKAYEVLPNFRVLYNLGQVHAERHDYVAAIRAFQAYLDEGGTEVPDDRRSQVQAELSSLREKTAPLAVNCNVAGAELRVDGVLVGPLPLKEPVAVNAGLRRVTITKAGYTTEERKVLVAGRQTAHVDVILAPTDGQSAPTASKGAAPVREASNPGLWISLAATGVFASGAAVFGVLTLQKNKDLDRELQRYPADTGKIGDVRDSVKLNAGLTDGLAAAAGISAVFTVYFLVSDRSEKDKASARLLVAPQGVAVTGTF
jgi:PEGA domain